MSLHKKLFITFFVSTWTAAAPALADTSRILFVGNTGAGKTTLINGTFNFAKNKKELSQYRFIEKLDQEERIHTPDSDHYMAPDYEVEKTSYAQIEGGRHFLGSSDTHAITGYRFTPQLPDWHNDLELIDSPGLNDTGGTQTALEIVEKLERYLRQNPDSLDAIVLVLESNMVKASKTCVAALQRIKALFPEEMAQKFFVVVNFSHPQANISNTLVKIVNENLSDHIEKEQFHKMNLVYLAQHNEYTRSAFSRISWDHYTQEKNFSEHVIGKLLNQVKSQDKKLSTYNYSLFNDLRLSVVGCLKDITQVRKDNEPLRHQLDQKELEKDNLEKVIDALNLYERRTVEKAVFHYKRECKMERKKVPCEIEVWEEEVYTHHDVGGQVVGTGIGASWGAGIGTLLFPGVGTALGALIGGGSAASATGPEQRTRRVKRQKDSFKWEEVPVYYNGERIPPFTTTETELVEIPAQKQKLKNYQQTLKQLCDEIENIMQEGSKVDDDIEDICKRAKQLIKVLQKNPYGKIYKKSSEKLTHMLRKAFCARHPDLVHSEQQKELLDSILFDVLEIKMCSVQ